MIDFTSYVPEAFVLSPSSTESSALLPDPAVAVDSVKLDAWIVQRLKMYEHLAGIKGAEWHSMLVVETREDYLCDLLSMTVCVVALGDYALAREFELRLLERRCVDRRLKPYSPQWIKLYESHGYTDTLFSAMRATPLDKLPRTNTQFCTQFFKPWANASTFAAFFTDALPPPGTNTDLDCKLEYARERIKRSNLNRHRS